MKQPFVLPACLLLLWTLTASVSSEDITEVKVTKLGGDKIELSCTGSSVCKCKKPGEEEEYDKVQLDYKDENSGEYSCNQEKIYVKFRTCDNCIELDTASLMGLVVGDLVATVVIGVSVYLVASQARTRPSSSPQNKGSDRQHLVSNEMTSRGANVQYEQLRHKGQKETYDVINKR